MTTLEAPKRRILPPRLMAALLGAISDPHGGLPNREQIEQALEQLAEAAAAVIRVMPQKAREQYRYDFEGRFAMALERRFSPNESQEEE